MSTSSSSNGAPMGGPAEQQAVQGPPYLPSSQGAGGRPTIAVDVPISAVFLFLFAVGAATHMTIFQVNRRRGYKFIPSAMTFGFCMARIVAMALRIAWAVHLTNVRLAIAANIMIYAGVVVLLIVNLLFSQRIVRAQHPRIGWSKPFSILYITLYALVIICLIMIITVVIQSFYTLDTNTRRIDRDVQLAVGTYFAFVASLPMLIILVSLSIPRTTPVEKFGEGRFRVKLIVAFTVSALLSVGAWYRAGTNYHTPTPARAPTPWYLTKPPFYVFNFTLEIIVVFILAVARVDQRFIVPNGANGAGSYNPAQFQRESEAARIRDEEAAWPQSYLKEIRQGWSQSSQERGGSTEDMAAADGVLRGPMRPADEAALNQEKELAIDDATGRWQLRPASKGAEPMETA